LSTPRMELNVVITHITNAKESRPLCTRAAVVEIPHTADVRKNCFESELVFLEKMLLVDPVIDEIPRQILIITLFLDAAQKGLTRVGNMYIIDILLICILEMAMRKTTVQIDESLLAEAIKAIGAKTQREAIEAGLKYLVQRKNREALRHELGTFDIDLTLEELEKFRNGE